MSGEQTGGNTTGEIGRRGLLRRFLSRGTALVGAFAAGAVIRPKAAVAAETDPAVLLNIGICTTDIERSTLFYTEVFGFEADPKPVKVGAALSGLMELENLDVTLQFLNKQGIRIELLQYANPVAVGDGARRPMNVRGLTHLAFKVTDIEAIMQAVTHMGGAVIENSRFGRDDVTRLVFVTDPDGTRIELQAA